MDKRELIRSLKEDVEALGEEKEVFVQWIDGEPVDYSYTQERKCNDPESLGNLLSILEE